GETTHVGCALDSLRRRRADRTLSHLSDSGGDPALVLVGTVFDVPATGLQLAVVRQILQPLGLAQRGVSQPLGRLFGDGAGDVARYCCVAWSGARALSWAAVDQHVSRLAN